MAENFSPFLKLILLFPLAGFLLNGLLGKKLLRGAGNIAAVLLVTASFASAVYGLCAILRCPPGQRLFKTVLFDWLTAGNFSITVALNFDPLSAIMTLIITGVGSLIHIYSLGYMKDDKNCNRFFSYLNLFIFFMLLLVLADNPVLMFVGWEGVGLCSYLLIGFWYETQANAEAGKKAFITNRIGDTGFLLGLMLLFSLLASRGIYNYDFATLSSNINLIQNSTILGINALTLICLLLFFGATGKSAQFPLYIWLPDAMAGPTPVSALIHAATMVTAGVYMLVRLNFLFILSPFALQTILITGTFTAFIAAIIATLQTDIKKVLAYSTISQLGYMFMAIGAAAPAAAMLHLTTHAFFKALLFLAAGSVIHGLGGEQDLFRMGGLSKTMRFTFILSAAGWLAISGIPPLAGFYSKDLILEKVHSGAPLFIWYIGLTTAALTAYYITRLMVLAFLSRPRGEAFAHESPFSMTLPITALAILSALGGWLGTKYLLPFLEPGIVNTESNLYLTIISVVAALLGIAAGFFFTIPVIAEPLSLRFGALRAAVYNKFYLDEIYDYAVVKPFRLAAKTLFNLGETRFIDGLVINGGAKLLYRTGTVLRTAQTGNAQHYALAVIAGLVVLLYGLW